MMEFGPRLTRRQMLQHAAASAAALGLAGEAAADDVGGAPTPGPASGEQPGALPNEAALRWLEDNRGSRFMGTTFGVAWPWGRVAEDDLFAARTSGGQAVAVQSWPLAYWPDGSIKWTGHAVGPTPEATDGLTLVPGQVPAAPKRAVRVEEDGGAVVVDTGPIRCRISRRGSRIIDRIDRDGRPTLTGGRLVCLNQDQPSEPTETDTPVQVTRYESRVEQVTVEQDGPVRAVVRLEGVHADDSRRWLPFVLRLYFFADSDHVRLMHSFVFDGDEHHDFIRGLGLRFDVPLTDETYNRHTRWVGSDGGVWAEAVRGITGLRRDPGEEVRRLQPLGKRLPPVSEWDKRVSGRLHLIPEWGDVTLAQLSSDGFEITKRTGPGHGWIKADGGTRASGVGYVGGVSGGVAFGQRDFWQRYPVQLDIRGAASDAAEVTMWMYSPQAKAMDLRFYHDGLGMDTYEEQLEGLEITYEDYEPGFGTPHGIARTTEFHLWVTAATPENQALADFAADVTTPPLLAASPDHLHRAAVFGPIWDTPPPPEAAEAEASPARRRIEENLDFAFETYLNQREQRRWYGFWDYGDVMHTYDPDRHVWRYDVGGYAWDNSELSPDLWLWYFFLRTGRADVFRFAEAMSRHTGEVDVYHLGRFAGLGTRHNVQHWGCSAKQLRISTVAYRRFYYYLTADERTGDLMREQVNSHETFKNLDPIRKIRTEPYEPAPRALSVGTGTDWSGLAMAWLTEWERTGDEAVREKLINSMRTLGEMPFGWFTGAPLFDPDTGRYVKWDPDPAAAGASHLSAVFGLMEVAAELIQLFEVPAFAQAWLDYCTYYNAPREEREAALRIDFKTQPLTSAHSRLTAYAAAAAQDPALAKRAWNEFFADDANWATDRWTFRRETFHGTEALNPVEETPWLGTNDASQWGLAAIQNLALVGEHLPPNDPRTGL